MTTPQSPQLKPPPTLEIRLNTEWDAIAAIHDFLNITRAAKVRKVTLIIERSQMQAIEKRLGTMFRHPNIGRKLTQAADGAQFYPIKPMAEPTLSPPEKVAQQATEDDNAVPFNLPNLEDEGGIIPAKTLRAGRKVALK